MFLSGLVVIVAVCAVSFISIAPIIHAQSYEDDTSSGNTSNTGSPTVNVTPTNQAVPTAQQYTSPAGPSQNTTPLGLVICTGARDASNPNDVRPICNFSYLLIEGRTIINWMFMISIPIAATLFAYGGILYMLSTSSNRKKANGIFTATGIGFGIMLIAWVSVYTIVSWLTTGSNTSSSNPTGITTFLGQ